MKSGLKEMSWNMNNEVWIDRNEMKHEQWSNKKSEYTSGIEQSSGMHWKNRMKEINIRIKRMRAKENNEKQEIM